MSGALAIEDAVVGDDDRAEEAEPLSELVPPSGVRVLVVDDEAVVRRAVRRHLTRGGFEVQVASDVESALAMVEASPPDLALVDLAMETSGLVLVRQLKATYGESMYVAVLSGLCEDTLQDQCVGSGADDYLVKSISLACLQRHLVAAARKQRAFVEARRAREHAERVQTYGAEAVSLLAHDLNNNLNTGMLSLDYLAMVLKVDDGQREMLDSTRYALQRMAALVGNFVDIARFEDDALHALVDDVDVAELLAAVMRAHVIAARGELVVDCAPGLRGQLDRALVERVLHNLVGNAVRHVAEGGTVGVSARPWPRADYSGGIEISVHNRGPEVAADMAGRLFTKYARGTDGRRGMGLYFCRLVCEAHGGTIELVPGDDGPTFRIRLPGRAVP